MKSQLSHFVEQLRVLDTAYRIKHQKGDDTLSYPFLANNRIITVWVGRFEPHTFDSTQPSKGGAKVDDLWFNGQIIKHYTSIDPVSFKVLQAMNTDDESLYGYFTTAAAYIGEDFSDDSFSHVEIVGSEKLDPASPDGAFADYEMRIMMKSGTYQIVKKPTWQLQGADDAVLPQQKGGIITLRANPKPRNSKLRLYGRFEHKEFGTLSGYLDIVVVGSQPVVKRSIEIIGADVLSSNATNQRYILRTYMSDGSFIDDEARGYWKINDRSIARFTSGMKEEVGGHVLVSTESHQYAREFELTALVMSADCKTKLVAKKEIRVRANPALEGNQMLPYYGKGVAGMRTAHFILGLMGRGEKPQRQQDEIILELCEGEKGYYAYPASWGKATFVDLDTGFVGGWESTPTNVGADVFEPDVVQVPVTGGKFEPFYIYETDYAGLGRIRFEVK